MQIVYANVLFSTQFGREFRLVITYTVHTTLKVDEFIKVESFKYFTSFTIPQSYIMIMIIIFCF